MIRLTIPSIDEADLAAVREALASGYLVQGPRVAAFEQAVAGRAGAAHAVAVSNCTAALHLALMALGIGRGDAVIVTAYSWVATANVIELCGAKPVFVDIRPDTFNLDPEQLESALEYAGSVKAVLPVHTFGQMADMQEIIELAGRSGVPVVEDAACALGATRGGRGAGTCGTMGCFSFHPRKAVTTGEGGTVVTDDAALASRLRALRNHGQDPDSPSPDFILPGFNCRMTEFQAALGLTQMAKLDRIIAARRKLAAHYDELLSGTPLEPPAVAPGSEPVYQSYVALMPCGAAERRAGLIRAMKERGIETTIGTWHMPMTTYFRERYGYKSGDFPVADDVFERSITLPLYETLTLEQQEEVVAALLACLSDAGA